MPLGLRPMRDPIAPSGTRAAWVPEAFPSIASETMLRAESSQRVPL